MANERIAIEEPQELLITRRQVKQTFATDVTDTPGKYSPIKSYE